MEGIRVVELAVWVAGPSASGILCDWGADVVKLEPPTGDPFRGLGAGYGMEGLPPPFELDNRGKRSVTIDLGRDEAQEIVRPLLEAVDVFVTNMRPGAVTRLGLDYPSVRAINERIIYAQVSAYGGESADAERAAFDVGAFWSRGGVASLLRTPDGQLPSQRGGMGDHFTGANAAGAISAALFHRERTGEGQLVSTSLVRTATYMLGWDLNSYLRSGVEPQPTDRASMINPLINSYQTARRRLGVAADAPERPPLARLLPRHRSRVLADGRALRDAAAACDERSGAGHGDRRGAGRAQHRGVGGDLR